MNKALAILLVITNIPLFGALASILFGKDGFLEAIRYLFIPDILSAFRGEFWEDQWAEIMFGLWVALCAILVWSEYNLVEEKWPNLSLYFASVWPNQ